MLTKLKRFAPLTMTKNSASSRLTTAEISPAVMVTRKKRHQVAVIDLRGVYRRLPQQHIPAGAQQRHAILDQAVQRNP